MSRRQTSRWLLITDSDRDRLAPLVRRLPRGSGVLLVTTLGARERRQLRHLAALRHLTVVEERRGIAVRVHDIAELRSALFARTPIVLLSPMFATGSHPDWRPLSRMRAAALARLAARNLVALGGMDERRYAAVARLGFSGWAGVSAFRT
jgi:thiamine-phosphate pyrophosphorylase